MEKQYRIKKVSNGDCVKYYPQYKTIRKNKFFMMREYWLDFNYKQLWQKGGVHAVPGYAIDPKDSSVKFSTEDDAQTFITNYINIKPANDPVITYIDYKA